HDQEEALDLADRVAIMNKGRIEQIGTPSEIFEVPKTPFVFDFLGRTNAFHCTVSGGKVRLGDKTIETDPPLPDGPAVAFVRPANIILAKADAEIVSDDPVMPGTALVRLVSKLGPWASVELLYEKRFVQVEMVREKINELDLAVGDRCRF